MPLTAHLRRHVPELVRLAVPATASRLGLLAMSFVDTVMVGRYATAELAWLSLANRSVIMFLLIFSIGLLMGVLVMTSTAYGGGDRRAAGRVWRRSVPYAAAIGLVMASLTALAPWLMDLLAADDVIAAQSARIVLILGFGLPAHLIFFCSTAFLEGIRRPYVPMLILLAANALNVLLDYALIFGRLGAPELGAEGSAWTTTAVRWSIAALAVSYIWFAPSMQRFGVRLPHGQRWRSWSRQRAIGYASAISIGTEVGAFAGLAVIAERLGALQLAGQEIVFNVLGVPFMLAVGIGAATAVRVAIAHGRGDPAETAAAGWIGFGTAALVLGVGAGVIALFPETIFALHSNDPELAAIAIPAIAFVAFVTIFDGEQATITMGLRGLGETWWPTAIQAVAYLGLMLPLSWYLAIGLDRGLIGLLEATLTASAFSVGAQSLRFWWLSRRSP
ncbi:MAG: MATE family efflux transporter [Gammaproteobacteria bacterium]|nr:MATE family efflux transporter [Gammaproteobacteria bacterium]